MGNVSLTSFFFFSLYLFAAVTGTIEKNVFSLGFVYLHFRTLSMVSADEFLSILYPHLLKSPSAPS